MRFFVNSLNISLETRVKLGLRRSNLLSVPFIYTVKDSSQLGTSTAPYRALLYYFSKPFFHSAWDIKELSKDVGKDLAQLNLSFSDFVYYNGIYSFGNLSPFDKIEEHEFRSRTKRLTRIYQTPFFTP
jgi:hypothetical protein